MTHCRLVPLVLVLAGGFLAACTPTGAPGPGATGRSGPADPSVPPALDAITADDIRRDLFTLAGDSMRGREAGTLDELRASAWIAERARAAGIS